MLSDRRMNVKIKRYVFRTVVRPALLHGMDTWWAHTEHRKELGVAGAGRLTDQGAGRGGEGRRGEGKGEEGKGRGGEGKGKGSSFITQYQGTII